MRRRLWTGRQMLVLLVVTSAITLWLAPGRGWS